MRTPMRALAALAAMAVAGCVTAPAATPQDPTGCWYFERDEHAAALNLPWGIRLADEAMGAAMANPDARVARTLNADAEAEFPFGYWAPAAGDSIVVGYPVGGGLLLRLARGDTSMHGIARALGDAVAPGAPARADRTVRLTRALCPAWVPAS